MDYKHISSFLNEKEADYLFKRLKNETPWTQVEYYIPERGIVITPRETWVYGYHLNKVPKKYNEIPLWLCELKKAIEDYLFTDFNYILLAKYRDQNDSIAYHSDDERFLGIAPTIASITVGETRPFFLKNKKTKETFSFDLKHGDLFVMQNNCQKNYMHSVPKLNKSVNTRISLTFRKVLNFAGTENYYKYNAAKTFF